MINRADPKPSSSQTPRPVHECDFCGRAVHPSTAVDAGRSSGSDAEAIRLCVDCAGAVE